MRRLILKTEQFPTAGTFHISRSAINAVTVVRAIIQDGPHQGQGECRPYARYDETAESVRSQIETIRTIIEGGLDQHGLLSALPPGAARNVVDCALWDLQAKKTGQSIHELLDLPPAQPRETAFTLSIASPDAMAKAAKEATDFRWLKIKVSRDQAIAQCSAVIKARPDVKLIIDPNEALSKDSLKELATQLPADKIALIEQPLPAGDDRLPPLPDHAPPICADESLHTEADLPALRAKGYRAVNVKLDKCGGLTAALPLMRAAKDQSFIVMAGCMVSTSLAIAPIMALESLADIIDLDGPELLAKDRVHGLKYKNGHVYPASRALWG